MTTLVNGGRQRIPLDRIAIGDNVRELDADHVDALAASIKLRGLVVPVIVRAAGDDYELVAGYHRVAAHKKLGEANIDAEIRDVDTEHADRAIENVARKQLNPYEEAQAVRAMLADGRLTEDGAAQALGWSRARVTARIKLLELPERAQQLVGAGTIPLSAVDQLRAIGQVSPELLEAVIDFLADGNEWAAERLTREPGWVLDSALREGNRKVFAAHLSQLDSYEIAELRLGKKIEVLLEEAATLHKKLDRYAYGTPAFRFSDEQIDQARAAGVVIEFERGAPVIVDRSLYRELAKDAIRSRVDQLREKAAAVEAERRQARRRTNDTPADPLDEAQREESRQLREIAERAHGVNLDLGASLLNDLATVDPASMDVARFFVLSLLGSDYDDSPYTQNGERVSRLAMSGIRLVIDEFRTDVTKTLKSGERGRLRIDYGDPHKPGEAVKWMWKFIDGAKTAGELYGRALVVIAAEQYASRLVVPTSQRTHPTRWASHKDLAAKALRKLAGPHLPASLKQLEQAIARAHREYDTAVQQHAAGRAAEQRSEQTGAPAEGRVDAGEEAVNDGEDDAVDDAIELAHDD